MDESSKTLLACTAVAAVAGAAVLLSLADCSSGKSDRVDFNRDIRPILNQNCTSCHGGVRQMGGVSFIYREEALGKGKSGRPTIVPGHPERSELVARITATDSDRRMPYRSSPLQPRDIALLKAWIRQGAEWKDHWAFVAPESQTLPAVHRAQWPRQPLDRFILARLEQEGIEPSVEADRSALLRRLSFDLIGLPPTPEELASFLADTSHDAYERQVDRLLASPSYGERWASLWLDLARYADSRGYEKDADRPVWPYRDWVIDAFNRNLPYNTFVITQLAGDLLPGTTLDHRIATTFQRLTPVNDEGGTDDEEFRLVAVMDRVATAWSVLNGVTMNCVQCHSHPYDPIRQREYYQFLSFYNTSRDADRHDDSPTLSVPKNGVQRDEVALLDNSKARLLREIVVEGRRLVEQDSWRLLPIAKGTIDEKLAMERLLAELKHRRSQGDRHAQLNEVIVSAESELLAKRSSSPRPLEVAHGEARAVGTIPALSVYEVLTEYSPSILSALRIEVPALDPDKAHHSPEDGFVVDRIDAWVIEPAGHERKIEFRYFVPDSEETLADAIALQSAPHIKHSDMAAYAGGFAADPKLFRTRWIIALPNEPLSLGPGSRLKIQLSHSRTIGEKPAIVKRLRLLTSSNDRWTAFGRDPAFASRLAELVRVQSQLNKIPSVVLPIMVEQASYERRQTLEFERGNFANKIGPALSADVPALFRKLPDGAPRDRLTMAQWFFADGQPLTARVAVNRYWEQLFGTGLVETLEDFGSAGVPPSHPELLDWLALHFQNDLHWNMKALLRELVTSATYRQSAKVTPALLKRDPGNRLLARGPQQRLTAEMVRDQALLASGLLNPAMGGPPVMPPQPRGVWMTVYNDSKWVDATGPDRNRRAIYTYLKRSTIYPSFVTFDASDRVVSVARRITTNTPLQALVTLNDPVYHEAAQALAKRMLAIDATTIRKSDQNARLTDTDILRERLNAGARYVLSRDLMPKELAALEALYNDILHPARSTVFQDQPSAFKDQPSTERSAFSTVAAVLLNIDAALTR